ncbi:two-component hybrid sensor and regulator (plasmid) [Nostoc sp. HK-01]|nr:two-component hybrid sensor and regulator [Nostoc sp. HK-01]
MPSLYTADLPSLEQVIECSPLTVLPNTPLTDVIALMNPVSSNTVESASNFSSCVLVVEEKKLLGIFTLRDIVRLIGAEVDLSRVLISEVMTQPVISLTLAGAQNALTALTLMRQHHIRYLPVVDEQGQLVGLITSERMCQVIQLVQLSQFNHQLEQEVKQRRQAQQELELRVAERTAQLAQTNARLQQEIEERKQVEAQLQQREYEWQALFDHALDAIAIADDEGRYVDVNPAACNLFGLSKEEILGSTIGYFAEPGFNFTQAWQQLCEQGQMSGEFRLHRPDGTVRATEFAAVANYIPHRYLSILRDVSDRQAALHERKQAEEGLRESEQRLQAIIDNSPTTIYVKDLQGRHLLVNCEFERVTNLTRKQIKNKTDYEIFSADIAQAFTINDQRVLTSFSPLQCEEILEFDDGLHTYLSVKFPLCDSDGQPYALCGISTDITEKKQLEQQFYRAQRLESIGTLASGIAHDLNNVFAPMMMISQLLAFKCKNVDAQTQALFKTLETSSKRGADLVKQILTFARGTEGKRILLQPGHLLKELVKVIKQTSLQSIEIVANIPTNTLWMVQADPTQLEQVFMNLAVNARDAMPNGGTLTITAENRMIDETYARIHLEAQAGSYIVVTFSDTGTGIPPEIEERIFEPFFTTKEVGKGTGLGLSTVSGIVKNHGGFIEVATQVGKGTKFQIFLPKAEGTASEITIETKLPRGKGELILVVDDEAVIQQITQQTLADYNYKTFVANDGIEAIALYAQYEQQISVVLLDMLMPNMDGLTAIRTLRNMNPNVKIIASSGLPTNEQKAIEAGADKFLYKPYTAQDLLTTLSDVIAVKK